MNIQGASFQFTAQYHYDLRSRSDEGASQISERVSASVSWSRTQLEESDGGMRLLAERLHMKVSERMQRPLPDPVAPFNGQAIRDRVLGFVAQRIDQARADGADDEAVNGLLDQAAEGVASGFADAREVLNALSAMNEALSTQIDDTQTAIESGIDALRPGEGHGMPVNEQETEPVVTPDPVQATRQSPEADRSAEADDEAVTSAPSDLLQGLGASVGDFRGHYRIQIENALSVSLTTREGDEVKIDLAAALRGSLKVRHSGHGTNQSAQARLSARTDANFVVEGHLNDAEQAAITDFLAQVADLADSFFNGDLGQAFEHALTLNADMSQLASYSINLSQSARFRASERYGSAEGVQQLAQVPVRAARLKEALSLFDRPAQQAHAVLQKLLPELGAERTASAPVPAFLDYMAQVFEGLEIPQKG